MMVRLLLIALGLMLPLSAIAQTRSFSEDNSDSVAVIIGNQKYSEVQGFPVDYAINDAEAIQDYLIHFLGFRETNVHLRKNATKGQLESIFRPERGGSLMSRVVKGRSNVFVFYSGHGVPDVAGKQVYLLPSDMSPDSPQDGYSLDTLYKNLDFVKQEIGPDRQIIVMIDACFTGETGRHKRFVRGTSLPGWTPPLPVTGEGLIKLVATSGTHPANWDDDLHLGLFTSRFLMGVAGLAAPGRGSIQWGELRNYLRTTVDADARRLSNGQSAQVPEIAEANLTLPAGEVAAVRKGLQGARDDVLWRTATNKAATLPDEQDRTLAYESYKVQCGQNGLCKHLDEAEQRLKEIRDRQNVAEDLANWERLSAVRKFQEYIDTCNEACAYRGVARREIERQKPFKVAVPDPAPVVPDLPRKLPDSPPFRLSPVLPPALPCQENLLTNWLREKGAYGGEYGEQSFDTSAYDDRVNWITNGKQSWRTRTEIADDEIGWRKTWPVQKYTPTNSTVVTRGEQCMLTQQIGAYKAKSNGKSERNTFKVTWTIRIDANGSRSIVGHQIEPQ
jgi:hypothetical protein